MEGMILLRQAREAGLAVALDGDALVIRGPKRAEPIARLLIENKPLVVAVLAPAGAIPDADRIDGYGPGEATWWRRHFQVRVITRGLTGARPRAEAERLAFGDLVVEWHRLHGERLPEWQCAGCDEPIGGLPALDLGNGNRAHLDRLDCVICYGVRWRGAATRALVSIGLQSPTEGDTP